MNKAKRKAKTKAKPKKKTGARKAGAGPKKPKAVKPVGRVTHFFGGINVAIVKFNKNVKVGARLHFKGATTDFRETAKSMQFDHRPVAVAPKGKEVGVKVKSRAREGDFVYLAQ